MDNWVVAGAKNIAKHLKDLVDGGHSLSDSSSASSSVCVHMRKFCPYDKKCQSYRLSGCRNVGKDVSHERETVCQCASIGEVSCSCGFDVEKLVAMENCEDCNALSDQTCLSPWLLSNANLGDSSECSCDFCLDISDCQMGSCFNRRIPGCRHTNGPTVKPHNSLESCLMAQLCTRHAEMEEHMRPCPFSEQSKATMRPLLVTDGGIDSNGASGLPLNVANRTGEGTQKIEDCLKEKGTVVGVPPLPKRHNNREPKITHHGGRLSSSSNRTDAKCSNLQGSSHGALLFCIGICSAIMASILSNKQKVDKLNVLLKQTEDLVHDLQEELEMTDSLAIKEPALKDNKSQDTQETTYSKEAALAFSSTQALDKTTRKDCREEYDQKTKEESMRKIEEELEAELARLELNMNLFTPDNIYSYQVEHDQEFVPDIAPRELRADMFGGQGGNQPYSDRDGSGSSSLHSINYAVSPVELTLRLHELLESRLEARVKELETELENSRKQAG